MPRSLGTVKFLLQLMSQYCRAAFAAPPDRQSHKRLSSPTHELQPVGIITNSDHRIIAVKEKVNRCFITEHGTIFYANESTVKKPQATNMPWNLTTEFSALRHRTYDLSYQYSVRSSGFGFVCAHLTLNTKFITIDF